MSSRIEGLSATQRAMRRLAPAMREKIEAEVDAGAQEIAALARQIAPRSQRRARSGTPNLASAIEVRKSLEGFRATGAAGNFARALSVGAKLSGAQRRAMREERAEQGIARFIGVFPASRGAPGWYAAWVEYGTTKRDAKPFLSPALHSLRKRVEARIRRAVNAAIKEVARRGGSGT